MKSGFITISEYLTRSNSTLAELVTMLYENDVGFFVHVKVDHDFIYIANEKFSRSDFNLNILNTNLSEKPKISYFDDKKYRSKKFHWIFKDIEKTGINKTIEMIKTDYSIVGTGGRINVIDRDEEYSIILLDTLEKFESMLCSVTDCYFPNWSDVEIYDVLARYGFPLVFDGLHSNINFFSKTIDFEVFFKYDFMYEVDLFIDFYQDVYLNINELKFKGILLDFENNEKRENKILQKEKGGRPSHPLKEKAIKIATETYKKYNGNIQRQVLAIELSEYLNEKYAKNEIKPISEDTIRKYLTEHKLGNRKGQHRNLAFVDE